MNKVISTLVLIMSCIVSVWGQAAPEDTAQKVTLENLLEKRKSICRKNSIIFW